METFLLTILLGLFPVIYYLYRLAYKNKNYWKELGVPSTKKNELPFFGNSITVMKRTQTLSEYNYQVYKEFPDERFCGYLLNRTPIFIPRDPDLISAIFIKDFDHFYDRLPTPSASNIISNGLFSMTGDKWRNLRYNLTPIFTANKLKIMFNNIKECSDEVVLRLKEKNIYEGKNLFFKFVINVIGDVAFGIKVNAFTDENGLGKAFLEGTNSIFSPTLINRLRQIFHSLYPKLAATLRIRMLGKEIEVYFYNLVRDMLKQRQKSNTVRHDFLQLMLEKKEKEKLFMKSLKNKDKVIHDQNAEGEDPEDFELLEQLKCLKHTINDKISTQYTELFTYECIAAQAFTFISAGSETVASVLTFTFFELALNQDVQTRLNKEIDATIKEFGLNYESIKKLTYLDQVLYETMRKYPPTGVIFRLCTKDYHIPDTDITLDKGTRLLISITGLHMDPKYFPDPDKFDPERFSDINSIPKGVYFPFGAGPRICIAMRLAMLEMKIMMATVISNFKVTLSKKTKLPLTMDPTSFVPKAVGGIWLNFEDRKKN